MSVSKYSRIIKVSNGRVRANVLGASGATPLYTTRDQGTRYDLPVVGVAGQAGAYRSASTKLNLIGVDNYQANIFNMINNDVDFKVSENSFVARDIHRNTSIVNYEEVCKQVFDYDILADSNFAYPTGEMFNLIRPTGTNSEVVGGNFSYLGGNETASALPDSRVSSGDLNQRLYNATVEGSIRPNLLNYVLDNRVDESLNVMRIVPQNLADTRTALGLGNTATIADVRNWYMNQGYGDLAATTHAIEYYRTNVVRPIVRPMGLFGGNVYAFSSNDYKMFFKTTPMYDEGNHRYLGIELSSFQDFTYNDGNGDVTLTFDYDRTNLEVIKGGHRDEGGLVSSGYVLNDLGTLLISQAVCPIFSRGLSGNNLTFKSGCEISYNPNGIPYVVKHDSPVMFNAIGTPPNAVPPPIYSVTNFTNSVTPERYTVENLIKTYGVIEDVNDYHSNAIFHIDRVENSSNYANAPKATGLGVIKAFRNYFNVKARAASHNEPTFNQVRDYIIDQAKNGAFQSVLTYYNFK